MTDFTTWTQQNLARLASDLWAQNVALRQQLYSIDQGEKCTCAAATAESNTQLELGLDARKDV